MIAATTRLYALAPIGLGTGQVETLMSYINRLAIAHCVSVNRIIIDVITPAAVIFSPAGRWLMLPSYFESFAGATKNTEALCRALAALTGREELVQMTMLPYAAHIDGIGLFHGSVRCCRACFNADIAGNLFPYERLLWTLRATTACPIHGTLLEDNVRCGNSVNTPRVKHPRTGIGFCRCCGSVGMACNKLSPTKAKPLEIEISRSIAELLAQSARFTGRTQRQGPHEVIQAVVRARKRGVAEFMEPTGVRFGKMYRWLRLPRARLALKVFANISLAHGVSLSSLLQGEWRVVNQPLLVEALSRQPYNSLTRADLEEVMHQAIESGWSSAHVAHKLGVARGTLRYQVPELVSALTRSNTKLANMRRQAEVTNVERIVIKMFKSGERLSTRNACKYDPKLRSSTSLSYIAFGRFRRIFDPSFGQIGAREISQAAMPIVVAAERRLMKFAGG